MTASFHTRTAAGYYNSTLILRNNMERITINITTHKHDYREVNRQFKLLLTPCNEYPDPAYPEAHRRFGRKLFQASCSS